MATKRVRKTWVGRAGESYNVIGSGTGKRVTVLAYDDGETVVKAINGDGRTASFVEYGSVTLHHASENEVQQAITDMTALL